jgi:DNA-binding transcriptional regulator YdaS (Cro superfamily)
MAKPKANVEAIRKAIEMCGGNRKFSHKTGISESAIVEWKSGRISPSPLNCIKIEKAVEGKITRYDIIPDYPWDQLV